MSGLTDPKILAERSKPTTLANLANKETLIVRVVPDHLKPFLRVYNTLAKDGFFEDAYTVFEENKDELPEMITGFAKKLIVLIVGEKDISKKYGYYQAFTKLVDYLGGKLGKNPHYI